MKYWAYVKNEILGPFEKEKLLELPEFSASLLICPQTPVGEKTEDWKEASSYPEISALLGGQGGTAAPAAYEPPAAAAPDVSAPLSPSSSPAISPLGEPSALSPEPASPGTAPAPEPAVGSIQLEPRSDAGPKTETGGLKHLNPTSISPMPSEHKEPGGSFDIPVMKLSGELSGHGKIGHPGTIQSEELHHSDPEAKAASPAPEIPAAQEAAIPQVSQAAEAAAPAAEPPAQAAPAETRNFSPSFDPISLSSIGGRNKPPEAAPETAPEIPASPAPQPAAAQAPASLNFDPAVIEEIIKRNLKLAVSPPPYIRSHLDPLVIKIDQMGEILSSMRNSQFQQEVLTKIRLIEDSVSELRRMVGDKQAPPAEKPAEKAKTSGFFGFGAAPAKKETPPAEKPPEAAPPKEEEIVDEGSKGSSSGAGAAVKKILRGIVTLVLLVAVLGGAAFMLRNLGIFDVTPYIPFAIPGLTPAGSPAAAEETAEAAAQPPAEEQGPPEVQQKPPELPDPNADFSPEIVFIARTYSAKEGGDILESKIFADAIQKNGEINLIDWKVSPPEGDNYKADAIIPLKDGKGSLTYSFVVERGNKRVTPGNFQAKQVMQSLFGQTPAAAKPAVKKPARKTTRPARRTPAKTAPKQAPKPAPKAAPAPVEAEAAEDDEYEYVYVEEEEAGGGDEAEYLMPGFGGR
jgi:hypothetical protein